MGHAVVQHVCSQVLHTRAEGLAASQAEQAVAGDSSQLLALPPLQVVHECQQLMMLKMQFACNSCYGGISAAQFNSHTDPLLD